MRRKPPPSFKKQLENVFTDLILLHHFDYANGPLMCCGTCAAYNLGERFGGEARVAFYAKNGVEQVKDGGIYLYWSGQNAAEAVVLAAERRGLAVIHDGHPNSSVWVGIKGSRAHRMAIESDEWHREERRRYLEKRWVWDRHEMLQIHH